MRQLGIATIAALTLATAACGSETGPEGPSGLPRQCSTPLPGDSITSLCLTVTTTGEALDANGYSYTVDGAPIIGINDTLLLPLNLGIEGAVQVDYPIYLRNVAANCDVGPANPVLVTTAPQTIVRVDCHVTCRAATLSPSPGIHFVESGPNPPARQYVIQPDGSGLQRPTDTLGIEPATHFAPSGAVLTSRVTFYTTYCCQLTAESIYVTTPDGRTRTLAPGRDAAWSPDGARVVVFRYVSYDGSGPFTSITVMNADGTAAHQITAPGTTHSDELASPQWTRDGARITFVRRGVIYSVAPDGTDETLFAPTVPPGVTQLKWAPDGSGLAVLRVLSPTSRGLDLLSPDGATRTPIVTMDWISSFGWSPDGTRLAFTGGTDQLNPGLFVVDADGTDLVQLPTGVPSERAAWH